jgi:predicted restriction endonuclease
VKSKEEVSSFMKEILRDKYFRKATHNTYAYRIEQGN